MMKRIMAVGVLAVVVAASAQGQLTAAGSNFSGPGGGGAGATGTVGAFIPNARAVGITYSRSTGMPGNASASFATATAPANVTVGGVTVSVDAASQRAAADAVTTGNTTTFLASLGTAVPGPAAQALAQSLASLGSVVREAGGRFDPMSRALTSAVDAFNAAINAMAPGTSIPPSLIAARAIIAGYYWSQSR